MSIQTSTRRMTAKEEKELELHRKEKTDLSKIPLHMRSDYITRNANIDARKMLCDKCDGTGNQLLSMYQKCTDCNGTGAVDNGQPLSDTLAVVEELEQKA
jgi:DnaJ-class molecular chaperone